MLSRRLFATRLGALSVALVAPAAMAAAKTDWWPDGRRAAVSLTYDDGLDSQLANVAPALDALGLKATFFITEENMDARLTDWVALGKDGHEIGDHTVTHPCKLRGYSEARFQSEEIVPMEAYLDAHFGPAKDRAYAYPCGFTALGLGPDAGRRTRLFSRLRAAVAVQPRPVRAGGRGGGAPRRGRCRAGRG